MLERNRNKKTIEGLLARFPVVALVGARQVGKSTMAGMIADSWVGPVARFDLENPTDLARLSEPMLALESLRGLVILDEVQRRPDLFPVLRVLADRPGRPASFLVLGSAAPVLLRQSSESLAGRIAIHHLAGLTLDEIAPQDGPRLWLMGGAPPSFLAASEADSFEWRQQFIRAFLETDLPQFGVTLSGSSMRRLWTMLAHLHGQILNYSELGRSFGVSDTTVRTYLESLESLFAVALLRPWHQNLKKRQVKAPKVFVSDSGMLHVLLGLANQQDLQGHPKIGASFEGFAMQQVAMATGVPLPECHFWATHTGAELDLLVPWKGGRLGFEFKLSASPTRTRSMQIAIEDLGLAHLYVVHAGTDRYPLGPKMTAVPVWNLRDSAQLDDNQ